jgi:hypothetical protein
MMIPSIAAPSAPAREAGKATADGFEQAMAAALGVVAAQAQPLMESADIGTEPGAVASAVHSMLPAGPHAGPDTGPDTGPHAGPLAGPGHGLDGGPFPRPMVDPPFDPNEMPSPGPATVTSRPNAKAAVEPMLSDGTGDPGGELLAPGAADEAVDDTTAQPVSDRESADIPAGRRGAPDGLGLTSVAEMAVASSNAAANTPKRANTVSQGADHAAISAQGLGLQRLRSVAPVAETIEDPIGTTSTAPEPIAAPPAGDPSTSATEAGDPGATSTSDLAIDRFRPVPEQAGRGADVATEARPSSGTERTSPPQAADRRPLQPDLPTLDPIAGGSGGSDQVVAQSLVPGREIDGGTAVPSRMLQRIEDAVRRLENAPPPRSITLTIDDQGLTRITVSVLSDGVRLTVPDGSQTPTGLVQDLEQALSDRGFELSGDRRHRERPRPDRDDAPAGGATRQPRRIVTDTAVRL